jgi:hypothetical protein
MFFLKTMKFQLEFVTGEKGRTSHVVLHQGGQALKGVKK